MKLLSVLLQENNLAHDISIHNLQSDSRLVKPGDLFIALSGSKTDGKKFIQQAISQGAVAVIYESAEKKDQVIENIPIIHIENLAENLGFIAARFYDYPSKDMLVIGVTGTNGKTSTTFLLAQALNQVGYKAGVIGTLGVGQLNALQSTGMTTPDALTLQKQFAEFKKAGVTAVAMEVSSHALDQFRVNGVEFDAAVFTNLTRDHLDYHVTMDNYARAKQKLFLWPGLKKAIINADDEIGQAWLNTLSFDAETCAYSVQQTENQKINHDKYLIAKLATFNASGIHALIESSFGMGELNAGLLGRFNCSNLLAVLATLCMLSIPLNQALKTLATCHGVPGRMQLVRAANKPLAIVDYAHTPDALEQVLKTIKEFATAKIICVFGCGGDRDKGKRPLMAKIAEQYADVLVLTSDNPRSEEPAQIVEDMLKGLQSAEAALIELDRAKAIALALNLAKVEDIILVAGKGHETTQTIKGTVHHFNDVEVIEENI